MRRTSRRLVLPNPGRANRSPAEFYAPPKGDVPELMGFIKRVQRRRPRTLEEDIEHRRRANAALVQAAEQIREQDKDPDSPARRAAEKILFSIMGGAGKLIPNNTHFDTTRANIEVSGAEALDLPVPEGSTPSIPSDFKGNMDLNGLADLLGRESTQRIPLCMLALMNNSSGWQPISM